MSIDYKSRAFRKFSQAAHAWWRITQFGYQKPDDYSGQYGRRLNARQERRVKYWERMERKWNNRLKKD